MWILRFHLLQPKDYNRVTRMCAKYGFISRSHSPLQYAKASIKYATQQTSWRTLSHEFHIDHAALARFYESAKKSGLLGEIFHIFVERKVALYIGTKSNILAGELDNSEEIYLLTRREMESMLS